MAPFKDRLGRLAASSRDEYTANFAARLLQYWSSETPVTMILLGERPYEDADDPMAIKPTKKSHRGGIALNAFMEQNGHDSRRMWDIPPEVGHFAINLRPTTKSQELACVVQAIRRLSSEGVSVICYTMGVFEKLTASRRELKKWPNISLLPYPSSEESTFISPECNRRLQAFFAQSRGDLFSPRVINVRDEDLQRIAVNRPVPNPDDALDFLLESGFDECTRSIQEPSQQPPQPSSASSSSGSMGVSSRGLKRNVDESAAKVEEDADAAEALFMSLLQK